MQTIAEDLDHAMLWSRYLSARDEGAFATLVLAHIDLVHAAARRLLPDHPQRADDVTQTVFCDLARKAGEIPAGVNLAGWLHRHTCFNARKMLRGELRRDRREHAAAMNPIPDEPATDALWLGVRPLLDEALLELEEPDRQALLLHFLQGKPFKSLALAFAVSEDAARMRVGRALNRLREVLECKGVTTTADALGHSLAAYAALVAPVALAGLVTAAAVSASAATTTAAIIAGLTMKKTLGLAAVAAAIIGGGVLFQRQQATIRRLQDEVWVLRPLTNEVRQLEERNVSLAGLLPQADEVAAARKVMAEIAVFRRDAALRRIQAAAKERLQLATNEVQELQSGGRQHRSEAAASLRPGESLVVPMDWGQTPGQTMMYVVSPRFMDEAPNQIEVESRILEMPRDLSALLGFEDPAGSAEAGRSPSYVFGQADVPALVEIVKQTDGAKILNEPTASTLAGRPLEVSVTEDDDADPSIVRVGPTLGMVSTVGADGRSIEIVVAGRVEVGADGKYPVYQAPKK